MTQTQVAYHASTWCCYRTDDARTRRYVGCRHLSPSSAIAHSDTLDRPTAATLAALSDDDFGQWVRDEGIKTVTTAFPASAEPPDPSSVPLYEMAQVGGSAESRNRLSGTSEARQ